MATKYWKGSAHKVAQVTDLTVGGTIEAGDLFRVTIGGKYVEVAATTTSATTTATEVYAAVAAAAASGSYPEFSEITWSNPSAGVVRATGTPGVPFTITPTTTEAGGGAADGQSFAASTSTNATGPWHWDNAANWSSGTIPASTDDIIITENSVPILYGLSQGAVSLNSMRVFADYTGTIGLPAWNANGYAEYRQLYLRISFGAAKVLTIGEGIGPGSSRLKFDLGTSNPVAVRVLNTGFPVVQGEEALRLINGAGSIQPLNIVKGSLGLATEPGTSCIVNELTVGYVNDQSGDVQLATGNGCAITTLEMTGGNVQSGAAIGNVVVYAGTYTQVGGGLVNLRAYTGARCYYQSTDTITYLEVGGGAVIDFSRDGRARTVTSSKILKGGRLLDPGSTITYTNPTEVDEGNDYVWDWGRSRTVQVA